MVHSLDNSGSNPDLQSQRQANLENNGYLSSSMKDKSDISAGVAGTQKQRERAYTSITVKPGERMVDSAVKRQGKSSLQNENNAQAALTYMDQTSGS